MHKRGEGDPSPDDPRFLAEVVCEHGNLVVDTNKRRRISIEVGYTCTTLETDTETLSGLSNIA